MTPILPDRIEHWDTASLVPYARNSRTHSEAQVKQIAASIQKFGFTNPMLVDSARGIIAGHGRLEAARLLRLARVPVIVLDHLTEAERRAYVIADNKLAENAGWDSDVLEAELAALNDLEFDLGVLGFSDRELEKMLGAPDDAAADECPPVEERVITQPGDLWVLGRHRLLCGDATKREDVERVMAGAKAGLMATDPPYGVGLRLENNHEASNAAKGIEKQYRHFERIMGDDLEGEVLQAFLERCFQAAIGEALRIDAAWYLWHAQLTQGFFAAAAAAAAAQLLIHRQIIWAKPHFVFGRGDYHWQHELCFYGWRQGNRPPFYGERNQSTLWILGEGGGSIRRQQDHPTQKPVQLFAIPIRNHTQSGELCYEPFAGSGTQFVAAEQLGRVCYGLEISPAYCDVIIRRWQTYTNARAIRESDGRAFDECGA